MEERTFVLASQNRGKLREMQEILSGLGIRVVLQSQLGLQVEVEETGTTFEENALLKAQAVMAASGLPAIADDSGLMVDALDGAPGVYSARFGGCTDDGARNALLLEKLAQVPAQKRGAKFVCAIVCLFPDGRRITARGECPGQIAFAPAGENGFGYDPLFFLPGLGRTMAQLSEEEKNGLSHRGRALRELCEKFSQMQEDTHADQ